MILTPSLFLANDLHIIKQVLASRDWVFKLVDKYVKQQLQNYLWHGIAWWCDGNNHCLATRRS